MAVNPWVGYEADAYVVGCRRRDRARLQGQLQGPRRAGLAGRASATARSTSSSRTGATRTWRRSTSTDKGGDGTATDVGLDRQRRHHRLVRAAVDGREVPGHHRLEQPQQVRRHVQDLGVRATRASSSTVTRPTSPTTRRWSRTSTSNFKVVFAGSEAALIKAFRKAEENKTPLIGYFYEPQWFLAEVPLVKVDLPTYTDGLRRRPGEGRLRLPAVPPEQGRLDQVRRLRQPGGRPGQELHLDQRRPEPRREVHRRGQAWTRTTRPRSGSTDNQDKVDAWLERDRRQLTVRAGHRSPGRA